MWWKMARLNYDAFISCGTLINVSFCIICEMNSNDVIMFVFVFVFNKQNNNLFRFNIRYFNRFVFCY
jgi:hypothetical protein